MAKSFSKFAPKKIDSNSLDLAGEGLSASAPDHLLASDLPVTAEEASHLLERVRQEEENSQKITFLEAENKALEDQLAAKETSIASIISDLKEITLRIQQEAIDAILLDVDDILKDACHDHLGPIIEQRINNMMTRYATCSFYANSNTLQQLGLSMIKEDNSLPENVIRCTPQNTDGHDFIIEVPQ